MAKSIPGVPESLTRAQYASLLDAVGIDPEQTTELWFDREGIHADVIARDSHGKIIPDHKNNTYMKHRVFIPVLDEEEGK